ncbi:MAG: PLP-dependent aminotransferase family protein [Chroococcidiopsidaceae cyanobacterium CP_BM_ER_R8_30]|nr:PLP-dependent aminotransferase family protein [Chroococcidiopsidaceae cyanobacterium CP_BM_ER_R8_30]
MLNIQLNHISPHPPYYLQISEQVRQAISAGVLTQGTRLPASRQLAIELGISRRTVVTAYEELCSQGYCVSHVGQGTVVAKIPTLQIEGKIRMTRGFPQWLSDHSNICHSQSNDPGKICFTPSLAQVNFLPLKVMRQAFGKVLQDASGLGHYQKDNGNPALIQTIIKHVLPARGIQAEPDQVLITCGSQYSSLLLSQLVAPYGGGISYGVPGYLDIPRNFTLRGLVGLPCPVDAEGVCLTEAACSARLHYVMPEHHFPQGVTLSPSRRTALLQLAQEQDALIIEDDYDSEFYYNRHPLPALKAGDMGGRVIYLGTFSKSLFNSLRLGYIVAHPEIIQRLVEIHWQFSRGTSLVLQLWVTELLETGLVDRHLRRMRTYYRHNRDLIASHLKQVFPEWGWQLPNGGLQFWVELPQHTQAKSIIHGAAERKVGLWSGVQSYECHTQEAAHRLILGFGALTPLLIEQAFDRLSGLSPIP